MDEQRQPEGSTGHAEAPAWRVNGASSDTGGRAASQTWPSHAGPEQPPDRPPVVPVTEAARHRQPAAAGLDDETPASGIPTVEPPLWREAVRNSSGGTTYGYRQPYPAYQPTPVSDLVGEPEPAAPPEPAGPPTSAPPTGQDNGLVPPATAVDGQVPSTGGGPAVLSPGTAVPTSPAPAAPLGHRRVRSVPTQRVSGDAVPAQRVNGPPEPAYATTEPGQAERASAPTNAVPAGLPQRIPAEPDVPVAAAAPAGRGGGARDRWTAPELAWIADQLRRDDVPGEAPAEPLDVDAVMEAVREVDGVRSASVRLGPTGIHTLRLDLSDEADPGQVSSAVARLLLERMGLAAAPQDVPQARPMSPGGWPPEQVGAEPVAEAPVEPAWQEDSDRPAWQPESDDPAWPGHMAEPASRPLHPVKPGMRVLLDQVQVRTYGLESTVEVQLTAGERQTTGAASGPTADSYLVRLAAVAAAKAIDAMLRDVTEPGGQSRCFVEHTGVMAFGRTEVAVVVVLLVCGGWVEQLTGSALVDGDPRQAVVRATLGAVNRRLEALLG